jgi:hypothetical protein
MKIPSIFRGIKPHLTSISNDNELLLTNSLISEIIFWITGNRFSFGIVFHYALWILAVIFRPYSLIFPIFWNIGRSLCRAALIGFKSIGDQNSTLREFRKRPLLPSNTSLVKLHVNWFTRGGFGFKIMGFYTVGKEINSLIQFTTEESGFIGIDSIWKWVPGHQHMDEWFLERLEFLNVEQTKDEWFGDYDR